MLNLIINAIQAMSNVSDGKRELHVTTDVVKSGEGVHVAVRDSGPGPSAENVEGLFQPFYTTKPNGMGMGLSICRSIIEDHGGRLWASRIDPQGALFQFTIPIAQPVTS
jgi:signal transduction histidine kinase